MNGERAADVSWGREDRVVALVARNVSTRYLAYAVDAAIGLMILPFNLAYLGTEAYGLWMLMASITVYLAVLDMGYGGALVRFVAQYRARRDARAINEILSTVFFISAGIGVLAYVVIAGIAFNLDLVFRLTPEQAATGRTLLLIVGANVALRFVFGVFGGVIVGFQRYHLNNLTSIATSLTAAAVNVAVLLAGFGVVALVAATTLVRILAYAVYRLNAYRVFPALAIGWRHVRLERLREVSGFGVFMFVLDWAYKLNYSADVLLIGALVGAPAVALWAPAQRLAEVTLRLTNQLNEAIFPLVVDSDTTRRGDQLRTIFLQATRLSLATVVPMAGGLALLAQPLLTAWIGPSFSGTAVVAQILALVVIVRVGSSTASVVLKGAGLHRRLTLLVLAMGVGNIALSVALVGPFGLTGVALGTLVPVLVVSALGIVPAACRRVGVTPWRLAREALWPALWPASAAGALLIVTRAHLPATLPAVMLQLLLASGAYLTVFFMIAIGSPERREYLRHCRAMLQRRPRLGVAA